jgi:hypothetical protein
MEYRHSNCVTLKVLPQTLRLYPPNHIAAVSHGLGWSPRQIRTQTDPPLLLHTCVLPAVQQATSANLSGCCSCWLPQQASGAVSRTEFTTTQHSYCQNHQLLAHQGHPQNWLWTKSCCTSRCLRHNSQLLLQSIPNLVDHEVCHSGGLYVRKSKI